MKFPKKKPAKAQANPLDDLARARARLASFSPEALVAAAVDPEHRKQLQATRAVMAAALAEHRAAMEVFADMVDRLDRALQSAVEA
ncbi:hypothetical protein ERT44_14925 [Stenotrophomonas sp. MA5]|jgi:hypothetical protein|uniref:hypothetical protein n=1 Tax=Stenotrophomonas sp. MA5 TaxID=2508572 RepID=UPI001009D09A|nr:hypothetical protein [Stenotrophomonas sp. MA5]RXK64743.1 hypothetical protein ERT44_14925 [Stenotrophomonas sp. MA5]